MRTIILLIALSAAGAPRTAFAQCEPKDCFFCDENCEEEEFLEGFDTLAYFMAGTLVVTAALVVWWLVDPDFLYVPSDENIIDPPPSVSPEEALHRQAAHHVPCGLKVQAGPATAVRDEPGLVSWAAVCSPEDLWVCVGETGTRRAVCARTEPEAVRKLRSHPSLPPRRPLAPEPPAFGAWYDGETGGVGIGWTW